MKIGIVGAEGAKFTQAGEAEARRIIFDVLARADTIISGGCHLGGIDIWAAEIGRELGLEVVEHLPKIRQWEPNGYKDRNLKIARDSDVLFNITVARLPSGFKGRRYPDYHCKGKGRPPHVKSGGCWTANQVQLLGKSAHWHVISNEE